MSRRNFMKSHNPVMRDEMYAPQSDTHLRGIQQGRMTVQGAINKTLLLAAIMLFTASISFSYPNQILTWGGAIGGLIVVFIASANPQRSPVLAPIYAALEGLFVGGITAAYAWVYNGIVMNAVMLTIAALFAMLFIYKSGLIKVTQKFRTGVMMATAAILVVYLANIVLGFFGINIPFLHEGGMMGIGISLVIIGVAALNLLLDFDNFEKGEQDGAPAYMEWFSGMGLLITLVWLYVEILRLLSLLSND